MAGEIVTPETARALVEAGAGATALSYAGRKIFGPVLDTVGSALNDRVKRVLDRTAEKLGDKPPIEVDPGFLTLFCQRASFSARDDDLVEMWASLLSEAVKSFSHKHVNYAEILSQLGPSEAAILDELVQGNGPAIGLGWHAGMIASFRGELNRVTAPPLESEKSAVELGRQLCELRLSWPGRVIEANFDWRPPDGEAASHHTLAATWDQISIDILIRQQLLEREQIESDRLPPVRVTALVVTPLGIDFIRCCRGKHVDT